MTGRGRKGNGAAGGRKRSGIGVAPGAAEIAWLKRGLDQPGGKLPLFDAEGQRIDPAIVRTCLKAGWASPWFENPLKPDWQVCRLTEAGRTLLTEQPPGDIAQVTVVIPLSP